MAHKRVYQDIGGIGKPALVGHNIYFVGLGNVLLKLDTYSDEVEGICRIPWSCDLGGADCIYSEGEIFCVFHKKLEIAVYDINTETIEKLYYGEIEMDVIMSFLKYEKILIMSKNVNDDLYLFDTRTKEFDVVYEWREWLTHENITEDLIMVAQDKERYAVTAKNTNYVIENVYPFKKPKKIAVLSDEINVWSPVYYKERLFVSVKDSYTLICADNKTENTEIQFPETGAPFWRLFCFDERLYVVTNKTLLYCHEEKTNEIWRCKSTDGLVGSPYVYWAKVGKIVYLFPWASDGGQGMILKLDVFTQKVEEVTLCVNADSKIFFSSMNYESEEMQLDSFLSYISNE